MGCGVRAKVRELRVSVDDGELHGVACGEAKASPLLFLHGSLHAHTVWLPVMGRLAGSFPCFALDQRGVGMSTAPGVGGYPRLVADVAAVVDGLGLGAPVLVGHSWGSKIALATAAAGVPTAGVVGLDSAAKDFDGSLHEDIYAAIRCPVLLVFATNPSRPEIRYEDQWVSRLAERYPLVETRWFHSDHDIHVDFPDDTACWVREFMDRLQSG